MTDDASVAEIYGVEVSTFEGDPENIKMTTPLDMEIAEIILKRRNT